MSVDYIAYAVLGCEVTGKLYQVVKVPSCKCSASSRTGRFCKDCGTRTADREATSRQPFYDETNDRIGRLYVVISTDNKRQFAGVHVISDVSHHDVDRVVGYRRMDHGDIISIRDFVREQLEPHGLWDPDKFGLWCVGYVSY